ncbi:unnamed protein product [Mytilus coruscus]|uniref:Integrase p58-like C-terminal domain-containing protein n=1 Tax=Mytilus coruscus TaxID=42192 RepID=A0A6J8DX17_MYTCO|nr:unnamed protein product [Mytilus coruscus]
MYPIPHKNADIIAEKLVHEFIAGFGAPLEIHADQGRNFESQLFAEQLIGVVYPATGHTPNLMMLGREINISSSILFRFPKEKEYDNEDQYITRLRAKMMEVYSIARDHLKSYAERQKRDNDTRIFQSQYEVGSLFYKFDKNINKKLKSPWVGPYKVTKKSPVVYEISHKNKTEIIHFDRLKPCTSD